MNSSPEQKANLKKLLEKHLGRAVSEEEVEDASARLLGLFSALLEHQAVEVEQRERQARIISEIL